MRATVTTPNGERFEGVTGPLLDYYKGEAEVTPGYQIVEDEAGAAATFPQVWENGERVDQPTSGSAVQIGEQPVTSSGSFTIGEQGPEIPAADGQGDDEDHPRPSPNPAA